MDGNSINLPDVGGSWRSMDLTLVLAIVKGALNNPRQFVFI